MSLLSVCDGLITKPGKQPQTLHNPNSFRLLSRLMTALQGQTLLPTEVICSGLRVVSLICARSGGRIGGRCEGFFFFFKLC